ncbi:MAG: aminotransferase class V-fold PLP-dependent enzyme [Clostridia bacterium]|nr:aminotransferase class V-fold PLP-dependent enzyme [Clostridia bacterium]
MIYLDNAATTYHKPQPVIDAVAAALQGLGNSSRGSHSGALKAARTVYDARCKAAALFGLADPSRVCFTSNSTEALNVALSGLFEPGDHVISTDLEHNSVLRPLYRLQAEEGVAVDFVRADKRGCVDYADFERLLRPETKAIVCNHASNLTGNALDLERLARITVPRDLLLVVDASQTAGCLPIDMSRLGRCVICFTGHKSLYGPQGTGGLCVAEGVEIRPFKVGGSGVQSFSKTHPAQYPTRLEAGTLNGHGLAGLSAALDFIEEVTPAAIHAKEIALMRRFYEGVKAIPGVTVYGDFSTDERAAIVALNVKDYDSGEVSDELSEVYGIATRPGAHCAPRMHEALGTALQGAVRFSFSYFNTEEETDEAVRAIREIAQE